MTAQATTILEQLREVFPPEDLEWRVQQAGETKAGKPWARIVAYVTNRGRFTTLTA